MRADNGHMLCDSVESCKDDAKPHQCTENNWEGTKLETAENGKENSCFCDSRGDKIDKEKDRNMLGLHTSEDTIQESDFPGKGESLEKGSVFYMDKSVTVCDMPEIVVCYKESTYHVVKDICVDEGVPVQEKFLFDEKDYGQFILNQPGTEDSAKAEGVNSQAEEQSGNDNTSTCDSKSLVQDMKDDMTSKTSEEAKDITDMQKSSVEVCADTGNSGEYGQEDLDVTGEVEDNTKYSIVKDMPTLDTSELPAEIESEKDMSTHHDSENLSLREEVATTRSVVSKESFTLADILSMEDGNKSFSISSNGPEEQSSQKSSGNRSLESAALVPELEDSNDSSTSVCQLIPEKADAGAAEGNNSGIKNTDAVELSSVSTSQESSKTAPSSKAYRNNSEAGLLQINDLQKSEPEHHVSRYNILFEDLNDHPFPSHFPGGFGESSFSAVEPVSGHITYSGPIAFSGSLSVRSDGSTTSTRSFAFPVLQSEWNSSPVRMAKAERRRLRSQKGWRQALLCCRF